VIETGAEVLDAFSAAVTSVVERVGPSVVSISARGLRERGSGAGAGSGVLFTPDGYLLTNAHVVSGAKQLGVTLTDGSTHPAELLGSDPPTDLAVVRLGGDAAVEKSLPYAELGSSAGLRVGQLVIAIGSGHDIPHVRPDVIIAAVRKLLAQASGTGGHPGNSLR